MTSAADRAAELARRATAQAKLRDQAIARREAAEERAGMRGHFPGNCNGATQAPAIDDRGPPEWFDGNAPVAEPCDDLTAIKLRDFIAATGTVEFLVDDVLRRGFLYSLTAPTGHGKTGVAVPLCLSVAAGASFAGHTCNGGPGVYVASENPDDVRGRFIVALERMRLPSSVLDDVHIVARSFVLAERVAELAVLIERIGAALVIVDTDQAISLSSVDDENSNAERMAHAKRLRTLTRIATRPTVLDLCHPRKTVGGRDDLVPRGGGAFLNEVDGNLRLWRDGDLTELASDPNKFRGAPVCVTFRSEIVTTDRLRDTKGRQIGIPHFSPITEGEAERQAQEQWTEENRLIYVMADLPLASQVEWATACGWAYESGPKKGAPRKDKVTRLLQRLARADPPLVRLTRNGRFRLTPVGEKEAKRK